MRMKAPPGITQAEWDHLEEKLTNKQFTALVAGPGAWHISAKCLLTAADILANQIIAARNRDVKRSLEGGLTVAPVGDEEAADDWIMLTVGVWIMLYALAVENLLKGVIAYKIGSEIHAGDKRKLTVGFHSLRELADRSGFKLHTGDADLLDELTQYSTWRGKYVVPTSAAKSNALRKHLEGKYRLQGPPASTKAILDTLIARLSQFHASERAAMTARVEKAPR